MNREKERHSSDNSARKYYVLVFVKSTKISKYIFGLIRNCGYKFYWILFLFKKGNKYFWNFILFLISCNVKIIQLDINNSCTDGKVQNNIPVTETFSAWSSNPWHANDLPSIHWSDPEPTKIFKEYLIKK